MSNDFIPNWKEIGESAVWREQIVPALQAMYQDGLERQAGIHKAPFFGSDPMSIDEFHVWRGWCAAIKAVLDTPGEFMEAAKLRSEEEEENARRRSESERDYRARAGIF